MIWHVLDAGSIWMKEFTSALGQLTPALAWSPMTSWTGLLRNDEREERLADPPQRIRYFSLQRGYHRFPFSVLGDLGGKQVARMLRQDADFRHSPLICTTPYYAPVAERWGGPVVYYQTDLTFAYHGLDPKQIRSLDTRLCRKAVAVCPNSTRIGDYMVQEAGCDPAKIVVVPNATRKENIFESPPGGPGPLPPDLADLPRPIAGVLGNLAANLDWRLLLGAVEKTPEYSWAFVGPTAMEVHDADHREARQRLMAMGGRVRFVGAKPYGLLQEYARAIDVAVLPYRRKEPTFSGSSTRFYEHLAACRPMLATRGFEELLHKEPLLTLVDNEDELANRLDNLKKQRFDDGLTAMRWEASRRGTWAVRAATLMQATLERVGYPLPVSQLPHELGELLERKAYRFGGGREFSLVAAN